MVSKLEGSAGVPDKANLNMSMPATARIASKNGGVKRIAIVCYAFGGKS